MWAESAVSSDTICDLGGGETKGGMTAVTHRRNVSWNLVAERLRGPSPHPIDSPAVERQVLWGTTARSWPEPRLSEPTALQSCLMLDSACPKSMPVLPLLLSCQPCLGLFSAWAR